MSDNQVVVAEGDAALGEDDVFVAGWRPLLPTTFFMSHGAMNCPFLTLTTRPVFAAATTRSVWRQRKAGICSTSRTSAAGATCLDGMDVGEHRNPERFLHLGEDAEPFVETGAAEGGDRGPVRLVVGCLEDERDTETPLQMRHQPFGAAQRRGLVLDHAGTGDEDERPFPADLYSSDCIFP